MADDNGSNSVSIVAILAILVLVGLVLYFVLRPTGDGLELDVDVDEDIGQDVGALGPASSWTAVAFIPG